MATHSSVLAWRIPWTEEPGGLRCTASQTQTLSTAQQSFIVLVIVKLRSLGAGRTPAVTDPTSGSFLASHSAC